MKKQSVKTRNKQLTLNKTAIANLTLSARQMARIVGGNAIETDPTDTLLSDVALTGNPCTARPTHPIPVVGTL